MEGSMESPRFAVSCRNAVGQPLSGIARDRPTFLLIGTREAGAAWIYEALNDHPSVFIPMARELQFFDHEENYERGWGWYLRCFKNAGPASAVGELTTSYWLSEAAACRIRRHLPDVRLICVLREPGDFAVSLLRFLRDHYRHRCGSTFGEIAENSFFTQALAYRKNLAAYYGLFPRDQIRTFYYEHMISDPCRFVKELYRFICVDPDYQPAVPTKGIRDTRAPRSRMLARSGVAGAEFLRRRGACNLVGAMRPIFGRLIYRDTAREEDLAAEIELGRIAENVRRQMAGELETLAQLVGTPLPAEWTSTATRRKALSREGGARIPAAAMIYAEL
jgi:hypothetical protein